MACIRGLGIQDICHFISRDINFTSKDMRDCVQYFCLLSGILDI